MRHYLKYILLTLLSLSAFINLIAQPTLNKDYSRQNIQPLAFTLFWKTRPEDNYSSASECIYPADMKRLYLSLKIENISNQNIGVTSDFVYRTGFYVRLIDNQTGRETLIRTSLADPELLNKFTNIAPGEHILLPYDMFAEQFEFFNTYNVDITAVFNIHVNVKVNNTIYNSFTMPSVVTPKPIATLRIKREAL